MLPTMVSPRLILAVLCLLLGLAPLTACSGGSAPSDAEVAVAAPAEKAVHVRLEGALGIGNMALLERALRDARANDRELVVVEIDTPGGRVDHAIEISRQLMEASDDGLRTIAWVNHSATSAGALVTIACERVYMDSTSTIGSALPVQATPGGLISQDGDVGEKLRSFLRSEFRARAEAHGRPKLLAEAMVDPDTEVREVRIDGEARFISGQEWDDRTSRGAQPELLRTVVKRGELLNLTGSEAVALGIADGPADSLGEVLEREGYGANDVVTLQKSRSEDLLSKFAMMQSVLIAVGLLLGYMELKTPGFGIAGILALLCLGLLLFGRYMIGLADVPHIVMVFVGAMLIVVEIFVVPGTLWLGLIGAVCVMSGLWLSEFGPGFSLGNAYDQQRALDAAFELGLVALFAMVGIWILSHFLPDTPVLRALVQAPSAEGTAGFGGGFPSSVAASGSAAVPGARGTATTDLRPVGKVRLDAAPDAEYEARADGPAIARGDRVHVVEAHGGRLVVEHDAADDDDTAADDTAADDKGPDVNDPTNPATEEPA